MDAKGGETENVSVTVEAVLLLLLSLLLFILFFYYKAGTTQEHVVSPQPHPSGSEVP